MGTNRWAWMLGLSVLALVGCGDDGGGSPDADTRRCEADSDCDDGVFCNGAERCTAGACAPGTSPCSRTCDEEADECGAVDCEEPDADGDGVDALECGGMDCDDMDGERYPGNTEVCDAEQVDEDCNPETFGDDDADDDGVVSDTCCNLNAVGVAVCGRDCDDSAPGVGPTSPEVCNGIDDDCDGLADEGVTVALWPDADGDGFGDDSVTMVTAGCPGAEGFATQQGDCNDGEPTINPSAVEQCNAIDDDCDGTVDNDIVYQDYYPDCDNDDFGDPTGTPVNGCVAPTDPPASCDSGGWSADERDCDDSLPAVNPNASEECNAIDDDCDGDVNEAVGDACVPDTVASCTTSCGGLTGGSRSCDNTCQWTPCSIEEGSSNPGTCNNGCDDDFDTSVDEGFPCQAGESCSTGCSGSAMDGTETCGTGCSLLGCFLADENCNYCPETNGSWQARERSIAPDTTTHTVVRAVGSSNCDGFDYVGNFECAFVAFVSGGGSLDGVVSGDTSTSDRGLAHQTTEYELGWDGVRIQGIAHLSFTNDLVNQPSVGFAMYVTDARSTTPSLGPTNEAGLPLGMNGYAMRWIVGTWDGTHDDRDHVQLLRLSNRSVLDETPSNMTSRPTLDKEDVSAAPILVEWTMTIVPDDPHTMDDDEEQVTLTYDGYDQFGNVRSHSERCGGTAAACPGTFDVGDKIQVGFSNGRAGIRGFRVELWETQITLTERNACGT